MIIEELVALLGFELKGEATLKRFQSGLDAARRKLSEFAAAAARFAAAAGAALGTGLTFLAKSTISTGAEFEKLRVQLEALEGSTEKAESALDWIRQFAKDTPLDLQNTVKAYASLRNFGLDPTNGSLMALVDTMAMSGKGAEHLDGLVLALGQAWTKGKLQGEEALQLIERGVPVWDMLSKATGKSTAELIKLSSAGKLGRDVLQQLIDQMGQRAAGASAKMAKTWEGITGRLSDSWQQFKLAVADAGWFDWVKARLEGIEAWIEDLWKSGTLDRLASRFSETFITVGESLLRFGRLAIRIGKWIGRQFESLGGLIADGLRKLTGGAVDLSNLEALAALGAALLAVFAPWTTALIAAFLVLDDILAYLEGSNSVIGKIIDQLPDLTASPFVQAFAAEWESLSRVIAAVAQPINDFIAGFSERMGQVDWTSKLSDLGDSLGNAWEGLKKLGNGFVELGAAINKLFTSAGADGQLASVLGQVFDILGQLAASGLIAALEGLVGILDAIGTAFGALGNAMSKLAEGDFLGAWQAIGQGIIDVAGDIASAVERMVKAFAPDFSFAETWEKIKSVLSSFAEWVEGWVDTINGLLSSIKWPEPPAWWKKLTGSYEDRRAAADAGATIGATAPGQKRSIERAAANTNAAGGGFDQMLAGFEARIKQVVGDQAVEQTVNQVANDNRVTNVEVNAPVSISATTMQTPEQIGASAGNAVRAAGRDAGRSLAVTGSAGGGGPR